MLRVGLLTSGGDCPGMNACVYSIVHCANQNDVEVVGIKRGFQGLIEGEYEVMTVKQVENIPYIGGTILQTARSQEFLTVDGVKKALDTIKKAKLDALIIIGGDGSFKGALELISRGVKCVAIPGTIDNDLSYTDRTLGFDTAVNNACFAIDSIRDTMRSHNRVSIIEVMGRHCGDISLYCAVASCAEIALIHEVPFTYHEVLEKVKKQIEAGNTHTTIVISENQCDVNLMAKDLEKDLSVEVKACILGYIQRGGTPTVADRILGLQFGVKALKNILDGKYGDAIGVHGDTTISVPIVEALNAPSNFNYELYNLFVTKNE